MGSITNHVGWEKHNAGTHKHDIVSILISNHTSLSFTALRILILIAQLLVNVLLNLA